MGKRTVRRRIFLSNALMVLVTLAIFLVINVGVIKIYAEYVEEELRTSAEKIVNEDELHDLVEDFTIHKNEFILLFLADGVLCIAVLVIMSQIFTGNLVKHIMEPLDELAAGAKRIRENDLTEDINYSGDIEFENVCDTFNKMQKHILREQEKNRKYEKARTDMIAGISHDLRTPLTAIRGTIKGLMDGIASTPEKQDRFLETAYRRTGEMDLLLNQLFYLSKIETGNMPITLRKIEISSFIKNYVQAKQGLMETGKEELVEETKEITAELAVDPEQLQRIFDNLLENSRKYGEKVPLKMKIDLRKMPGGILIRFSDNVVGVPENKLPHVFDEFYRVDESRNKKEGNGLGLYIVKYLIEAMGGTVWAENEDGFVVSMELPLGERKGADNNGR